MLSGKLVVNTRSRVQADSLTELLVDQSANVVCIPCLDLCSCVDQQSFQSAIAPLQSTDWVVFTSVNGVWATAECVDSIVPSIAVLGEKTATAVARAGWTADFVGSGVDSKQFAVEFLSFLTDHHRSTQLLLLRGKTAAPDLPVLLKEAGCAVAELTVYKSVLPQLSEEEQARFVNLFDNSSTADLLVFTSSQAVRHFLQLGFTLLNNQEQFLERARRIPLAVIGARTAETAKEEGFMVAVIAKEQTIESLVAGIVEWGK